MVVCCAQARLCCAPRVRGQVPGGGGGAWCVYGVCGPPTRRFAVRRLCAQWPALSGSGLRCLRPARYRARARSVCLRSPGVSRCATGACSFRRLLRPSRRGCVVARCGAVEPGGARQRRAQRSAVRESAELTGRLECVTPVRVCRPRGRVRVDAARLYVAGARQATGRRSTGGARCDRPVPGGVVAVWLRLRARGRLAGSVRLCDGAWALTGIRSRPTQARQAWRATQAGRRPGPDGAAQRCVAPEPCCRTRRPGARPDARSPVAQARPRPGGPEGARCRRRNANA